MAKTAFVDFKAVKAAITMEQVLQYYGLLEKFKRGTDSLNGPCPIHKGSNPTQFRVSLSKNIWNCFSECKHGGNTLDFIAEMEKVSIHAAALKAIEWFNLDPEAMAANSDKGESGETQRPVPAPEAVAKPASSPKPAPASAPESSAPNAPLKFRLDKLERSHPYLTEQRGLTPETIVDF
ncbi:MAG: CHC2 zinc finger domain-containing protein, partial [Verrucomicrobiota bacterium]